VIEAPSEHRVHESSCDPAQIGDAGAANGFDNVQVFAANRMAFSA